MRELLIHAFPRKGKIKTQFGLLLKWLKYLWNNNLNKMQARMQHIQAFLGFLKVNSVSFYVLICMFDKSPVKKIRKKKPLFCMYVLGVINFISATYFANYATFCFSWLQKLRQINVQLWLVHHSPFKINLGLIHLSFWTIFLQDNLKAVWMSKNVAK